MVRKYVRKTPRTAPGLLDAATKEVLEGKSSVRAAAKNNNIPRITLHDHVKRQREIEAGESVPHCPTRSIFTEEEEQKLANYVVRAADIYFWNVIIVLFSCYFNVWFFEIKVFSIKQVSHCWSDSLCGVLSTFNMHVDFAPHYVEFAPHVGQIRQVNDIFLNWFFRN